MFLRSISSINFWAMLAVSGFSILVLGGVWAGKMVLDFTHESERLREEYYDQQKQLMQEQVSQALTVIEHVRRKNVKRIREENAIRLHRAEVIARAHLHGDRVDHATESVLETLVPGRTGVASLFRSYEGTLYMLAPFPGGMDAQGVLLQLSTSLQGVVEGERRVVVQSNSGRKQYTLLLETSSPVDLPFRFVTGACLEVVDNKTLWDLAERLESMRFGEGGYIFAGTWDGTAVVGPDRGVNIWDARDSEGVKYIQRLIVTSKNGGGFVSYKQASLSDNVIHDKVSYAAPVPRWRWFVAGGLHVDAIEARLADARAELEHDLWLKTGLAVALLILLSFLAFMISLYLAKRMRNRLQAYSSAWAEASASGEILEVESLKYSEFQQLVEVANDMLRDRALAESKARKNAENFETLVSNIPGVVYHSTIGEQRSVDFISDAVFELTGYPASDYMEGKRSFDSMMDERDIPWVEQIIEEHIIDGKPYALEYRVHHAMGTSRWVLDQGRVHYDDNGEPVAFDGVLMDVTQRRQTDEERRAHVHFLESMERVDRDIRRNSDMESMLSAVVETLRAALGADRAWLMYPCVEGAETFSVPVERTVPEFPGAGLTGAPLPVDEETADLITLVLNSSGPVAFDASTGYPIPSGLRKEFSVQSQLLVPIFPRTDLPWVLGVHQCRNPRIWNEADKLLFKEASRRLSDALSETLMSKELRQSEERFRTFSEQTMLGIGLIQDDRITFANQAFCDLFEVSIEELLSMPPKGFMRFVHPDDRAFVSMQVQKKQRNQSGAVGTYEWRAITATGRVRWVEIHSKTIHIGGGFADLICLLDVSKIHKTGQDLQSLVEERTAALKKKTMELEDAYDQLSRLDRMKSMFLTSVAHDLRTPLTSVLGYVQLIRKDLEKVYQDRKEDRAATRILSNLEIVSSEARRLNGLFDVFMDLTAIHEGSAKWKDVPVDPVSILSGVSDSFRYRDQYSDAVRFEVNIPEKLPLLHLDPKRLVQVVSVLLDNAFRHTAEGVVSLAASAEGGHFVLTVSDTGSGIPAADLAKVFEPFHQVDTGDTLNRTDKGPGLGLTLCRQIVEHYGGVMEIDSIEGKGATFIVRIPLPGEAS
ncbi:MAG: hypothetical protein CL942_08780 [Desulfovibrio sp.]|nr:hypothetical protein [Desulfovibrio sp.]|tara:strand:- start:1621 stop:4935 length:3315 start_codon:yes stop_codon:yes gene_type:complete